MKSKFTILFFITITFFACNNKLDKTSSLIEAQKFLEQKEYKESFELSNKLIKQYPDFDSAYVVRGIAKSYLFPNQTELAILDYSRAIDINFNNLKAFFNRAISYAEIEDYKAAIKDYSHIINLGQSEHYCNALFERALLFDYLEQPDNAISDMKSILVIDSTDCEVISGIGVLYYARKKEMKKGLEYLNKAINMCPDRADTYFKRGLFFDKYEKFEEALSDYNTAISLTQKSDIYYMNRGLLYSNIGQIDKALDDLNRAIELNPNNGLAYENRGYIKKLKLKDIKGAKKDFKKAKELGVY
jgi:tetratricopeptide (TPR) repeat protein